MPTVGVIGGGQLARMMQPAAIAMGVELKVLRSKKAQPLTTQPLKLVITRILIN